MTLNELRNLDYRQRATWPMGARIGAGLLIIALVLTAVYFLKIKEMNQQRDDLDRNVTSLLGTFKEKAARAANLEPLIKQLEEMETILQQLLRQLPGKTDLPNLLIDVSQTALSTGIDNELFEPQPENPQEFYAEKPIKLRLVGSFHEFGAFVSGVANLPRVVILTMNDIVLTPRPNDASKRLVLEGTARTYRYLDEEELNAKPSAAANATPGAR
jgi:type IV pilus assembly protein PilO